MTVQPSNEDLLEALTEALDEPDHVDHDPAPGKGAVAIYAFGRNFVDDCDEGAEDNLGYVLVTCGMSRQRMPPLPEYAEDGSRAVELIWYVKSLDPIYFEHLRWLAKLPAIDKLGYFHGRSITMPEPPLTTTAFKTFLLLPPIYDPDAELFEGLETDAGDAVSTLVVHLISDAEQALIKSSGEGLDDFLDLLDDKNYPMMFDPARASYV